MDILNELFSAFKEINNSEDILLEGRVHGRIMKNHEYSYMGLFVDPVFFYNVINHLLKVNNIKRHSYEKEIDDPHVTLRHYSENKPFVDSLFGQEVDVIITHYGYDDILGNEGVKISFKNLPNIPELKHMIITNGKRIGGMDNYHITLSIGKDSEAKNTKDIRNWIPLKRTTTIKMIVDGFFEY